MNAHNVVKITILQRTSSSVLQYYCDSNNTAYVRWFERNGEREIRISFGITMGFYPIVVMWIRLHDVPQALIFFSTVFA